MKDGVQGQIKGVCDTGNDGDGPDYVRADYALDNSAGHSVILLYGGLDGYFTSDTAHNLQAGDLQSWVHGDDLVLYC